MATKPPAETPALSDAQRLEFFEFLMKFNGSPPDADAPAIAHCLWAELGSLARELAFGVNGTAH